LPLRIEPVKLPDGTITCTYQVGRITIAQRLTPQQYTPTTGAIFIQYVIENNDTAAHQVGLLLEMDTLLIFKLKSATTCPASIATRWLWK
jgi:hypothetical protein